MRIEDIEYSLLIRKTRSSWGQEWDQLVLTAPVVGTDGEVRKETHTVIFGMIKVLSRSVRLKWVSGSIWRGDKIPDHSGQYRDITVPKSTTGPTAHKNLMLICERLGFLVAPQHTRMFYGREARRFCEKVHNLIIINEVMGG
jgi:hypothetical protein